MLLWQKIEIAYKLKAKSLKFFASLIFRHFMQTFYRHRRVFHPVFNQYYFAAANLTIVHTGHYFSGPLELMIRVDE